jgi:hypothetical protein
MRTAASHDGIQPRRPSHERFGSATEHALAAERRVSACRGVDRQVANGAGKSASEVGSLGMSSVRVFIG